MDHETAIRLEAAERYVLGQMTPEDRDSFEEHFFLCSLCADDVRELAALKANYRALAADSRPAEPVPVPRPLPAPLPGFFSRLGPGAVWGSLLLNAVLLLFGVYHFAATDRAARQLALSPLYLQEVPLLGVVRSDTPVREVQPRTKSLLLTGYLQNEVSQVSIEIREPGGKVLYSTSAPAPPREPSSELHLAVPVSGLRPGVYEITVRGSQNGSSCLIGESRIRLLAP